MLRLAVDIGGTFTDTVLIDDVGEFHASTKVLTSHDDPSQAAWDGCVQALEEAGRNTPQAFSEARWRLPKPSRR